MRMPKRYKLKIRCYKFINTMIKFTFHCISMRQFFEKNWNFLKRRFRSLILGAMCPKSCHISQFDGDKITKKRPLMRALPIWSINLHPWGLLQHFGLRGSVWLQRFQIFGREVPQMAGKAPFQKFDIFVPDVQIISNIRPNVQNQGFSIRTLIFLTLGLIRPQNAIKYEEIGVTGFSAAKALKWPLR